jgi:spermidine dehydrogenase
VPRARKSLIFGGEGKQNGFVVDGRRLIANQGSDHFSTPRPGTPVADLYASIGVDATKFEYQSWEGSSPEIPVGHSFEHIRPPFGVYSGASFGQKPGIWFVDPWTKKLEGAPMPDAMRAEIVKYRELGAVQGTQVAPVQKPPELDTITMEEYMIQKLGLSPDTMRKCLVPGPGDGLGLGPDVISAYAFGFGGEVFGEAVPNSARAASDQTQSFAGGNGGFARHIVKMLLPHTGAMFERQRAAGQLLDRI